MALTRAEYSIYGTLHSQKLNVKYLTSMENVIVSVMNVHIYFSFAGVVCLK